MMTNVNKCYNYRALINTNTRDSTYYHKGLSSSSRNLISVTHTIQDQSLTNSSNCPPKPSSILCCANPETVVTSFKLLTFGTSAFSIVLVLKLVKCYHGVFFRSHIPLFT